MNLDFSPEDLAFRDEVRAFIAENYPDQLRGKQDEGEELSKDDFLSWHRTLAAESAGKGPGPESSLLKIKGTEIQQRVTELALEAAGHYGAPYFRGFPNDGDNMHPIGPEYAHRTAPTYFNVRKTSIYGGSNEIQRNIIAKMVLGL